MKAINNKKITIFLSLCCSPANPNNAPIIPPTKCPVEESDILRTNNP